jgi:hypothetical protein
MKYEIHGLTKAEEEKTNPGEDQVAQVGSDIVRWKDGPSMTCWSDFTERLADGRSWAHRCPREGDFTNTIGLCPKHYEEIIGNLRAVGRSDA